MKKNQRILSVFLALTLLLGLWPPARVAADEGITVSLTASQSSVPVGETVSVTIRGDRAFVSRGSGMTVYYDDAVLEPDLQASSAVAPFRIDGPMKVDGKTALRISFLPGLETAAFSVEEALAKLSFKALAVAEQTEIILGAAYLYDERLTEIPVILGENIRLTVEPSEEYIPVNGIALDQTELHLEEGEMQVLKALIEPTGASDPTVIWMSSDETVAIVSDGVVKALSAGTATITAITNDGGFTAFCVVTVTLPDAGYTVKMPADLSAVIGGIVQIPVVISHEDGKTGYNAFDISFIFDPAVLELVSTELPDMTIRTESGKVEVLTYGEERRAGSVPCTLEFRALKMENTEIRITDARVDNSDNAAIKNASLATLLDDRTVVSGIGYPVSLPEGFTGEPFAQPNQDYIFREPEDYYDYTVSATVDGMEVGIIDNGDGSYIIPAEQVVGEIIVTAIRTGKVFKVTLGSDMTGEITAQYGTDYVATIDRDDDYRYTVTVTIGGRAYTGYEVSGNTITIPGGSITGDIVFVVEKEEIAPPTEPVTMHSVTFTGSGAGAAQGNATSVAHGASYTLTLKKESGYTYQVSYIMGGKPETELISDADGTYTIESVTAPVEFIIEKTLDLRVSVYEYVNLEKKTMFLVLVDTELDNGKIFTYDGNAMYYSEGYRAWAYLVMVEDEFDAGIAAGMIHVAEGTGRILRKPDYDVNGTGLVDINDAQLAYDIYNGKYDSFDRINMIQFLNADVNLDKTVTVQDAAGVVANIP